MTVANANISSSSSSPLSVPGTALSCGGKKIEIIYHVYPTGIFLSEWLTLA